MAVRLVPVVFLAAGVVDAFFAVVVVPVDLLAVEVLAAVDLAAVDLLGADLAVVLRVAGAFAADFVAVVVLAAGAVRAAVLFAVVVDFAAVDRPLAVPPVELVLRPGVVVLAVFAVVAAATAEAFGSFFSPDTICFSSAPALNFGTAVFLARLRSPVRGLRTIRDGRATFSKAPKPVMATFSPLTSSRWMTSMTEASA